ncbi:hypothetical protein BO82DRAFT_351542 [Aspergillus uvarum CBS 121591]|uniref:Uncharacterized protein n=1 Tax=Aspergillus uvarum CBS 121591 TaxID=1448315 RepID=A0A319CJS5_9EURO|nr:hypothetical protein BO82DRAFT_351542 [Aspergillus uvarum CBS 121591]PYH84730.1 hypothetical protein BO82DRAFT_351542 [Aspergillus uvarum CBS 121591]
MVYWPQELSRATARSFNTHVYTPPSAARPSVADWWICCACGSENNPALSSGRCTVL